MVLHGAWATVWPRLGRAIEAACGVRSASSIRYGMEGGDGRMDWGRARRGAFPGGKAGPPVIPPPLPSMPNAGAATWPAWDTPSPSAESARRPATTLARVCTWCAKSIPAAALWCPYCHKLRYDIAKDRRTLLSASVAAAVFLGVAVALFALVWNESREPKGRLGFSNSELQEVWHVRVETPAPDIKMFGVRMPSPPDVHCEFSMSKFLTSVPGWLVIASGGLGLGSLLVARGTANKVTRKTGQPPWTLFS